MNRNIRKNSIKTSAKKVASLGDGNDKILAHINPEEAMMLSKMFGHDINQHTGLPQFGNVFRKAEKSVRKVVKKVAKSAEKTVKEVIRHPLKNGLPFLVQMGANLAGIPSMFGTLGAGAAGAFSRGDGNRFPGFVSGVGKGLAFTAAAPWAASKFGADPQSLIGRITGLNQPSLMHQTGLFEGAPSTGGGIGGWSNTAEPGFIAQGLKNGFGWQGGLTGSIGKTLSSKGFNLLSGVKPGEQYEEGEEGEDTGGGRHWNDPDYGQYYNQQNLSEGNSNDPSNVKNYNGSLAKRNMDYSTNGESEDNPSVPLDIINKLFNDSKDKDSKKTLYEKMMSGIIKDSRPFEKNKNLRKKPEVKNKKNMFASGGFVSGGMSGGRDDDVEVMLPRGSHVITAPEVSMLGDGNTNNGARKLIGFEKSILGFNPGGNLMNGKGVRSFVSNGEYVLSPNTVDYLGLGNSEKGSKVIYNMRKNIRNHKATKKALPPKAKTIEDYIKGKR